MRALVAVALLTLGAAGCSGKDDSAGPDVAGPSPATDGAGPVVASVVSTTTTTTTTAPTTVAPSSAPPTIAAPLTTAGPATGPYQPTTAPTFPSRSTAPPADGLPDGSYYAVVRGAAADAPTPRVATTIYQLLTGPEAIAAAQAAGHGLDSDIFVPEQPAADRDIELRPDLLISVARPDRPDVSYAISAAELARLVNGGAPSTGAPDGYHYVPFPYLITVTGGVPTRLEQLWAP
jgi:hypothetical protein